MRDLTARSEWLCQICEGPAQVCLPAWHIESEDGTLTYVETDSEADVMSWYCEVCNESGPGEPLRR